MVRVRTLGLHRGPGSAEGTLRVQRFAVQLFTVFQLASVHPFPPASVHPLHPAPVHPLQLPLACQKFQQLAKREDTQRQVSQCSDPHSQDAKQVFQVLQAFQLDPKLQPSESVRVFPEVFPYGQDPLGQDTYDQKVKHIESSEHDSQLHLTESFRQLQLFTYRSYTDFFHQEAQRVDPQLHHAESFRQRIELQHLETNLCPPQEQERLEQEFDYRRLLSFRVEPYGSPRGVSSLGEQQDDFERLLLEELEQDRGEEHWRYGRS